MFFEYYLTLVDNYGDNLGIFNCYVVGKGIDFISVTSANVRDFANYELIYSRKVGLDFFCYIEEIEEIPFIDLESDLYGFE